MDFGAKGDGKVLDTQAVVDAFASCSSAPPTALPCIINFPSPHKFLLSPFNVSSNTVPSNPVQDSLLQTHFSSAGTEH
jgi:hypothetical protein